MLYDKDRIAPENDSSAEGMRAQDIMVEVRAPDPIRQGVVDVVSMRALARAFVTLVSPPTDTFDRALTRTLNINGSIAAGLLDEHR